MAFLSSSTMLLKSPLVLTESMSPPCGLTETTATVEKLGNCETVPRCSLPVCLAGDWFLPGAACKGQAASLGYSHRQWLKELTHY